MKEQKITYLEEDSIRVIRGTAENVDNNTPFITIKRREGEIKINRNNVVKIEEEA